MAIITFGRRRRAKASIACVVVLVADEVEKVPLDSLLQRLGFEDARGVPERLLFFF